jgi:hypothetical protein
VRPAREAGLCASGVLLEAGGQKGARVMFEALSTSQWKWTWRFLLLCCASVLLFLLSGLLAGLYPSLGGDGGPSYYVAVLGLAGFAVGIIGAVVSFVTTMARRRSPPAKPMA